MRKRRRYSKCARARTTVLEWIKKKNRYIGVHSLVTLKLARVYGRAVQKCISPGGCFPARALGGEAAVRGSNGARFQRNLGMLMRFSSNLH